MQVSDFEGAESIEGGVLGAGAGTGAGTGAGAGADTGAGTGAGYTLDVNWLVDFWVLGLTEREGKH